MHRHQSVGLKGDLANTNLQNLIGAQIEHAQQVGRSDGDELATLIPLTVQLMLYTAATDREIDWPPAERISRPHQMRDTRVGNPAGASAPRCGKPANARRRNAAGMLHRGIKPGNVRAGREQSALRRAGWRRQCRKPSAHPKRDR